MFFPPCVDAVAFAREVLDEILSGIEDKNVGELLRQAEVILQEIRARDFNNAKDQSMEELGKAMEGEGGSGSEVFM